jgi:hypothetical protein
MKPILVANPATDSVFVSFADMLVDHGARSPAALEDRLRTEYPRAVVHERVLAGESATIWYVYRDGRWVPTVGNLRAELRTPLDGRRSAAPDG